MNLLPCRHGWAFSEAAKFVAGEGKTAPPIQSAAPVSDVAALRQNHAMLPLDCCLGCSLPCHMTSQVYHFRPRSCVIQCPYLLPSGVSSSLG
jgi:hypothetical protein